MGPSAGWLELVSPVAAGGVDAVFAEDFAGVEVDDCHGGSVDEGEDAFAATSCIPILQSRRAGQHTVPLDDLVVYA